MNAVDTNVLFYAHDQRDVSKREVAVHLIASSLLRGVPESPLPACHMPNRLFIKE